MDIINELGSMMRLAIASVLVFMAMIFGIFSIPFRMLSYAKEALLGLADIVSDGPNCDIDFSEFDKYIED